MIFHNNDNSTIYQVHYIETLLWSRLIRWCSGKFCNSALAGFLLQGGPPEPLPSQTLLSFLNFQKTKETTIEIIAYYLKNNDLLYLPPPKFFPAESQTGSTGSNYLRKHPSDYDYLHGEI